jgi:hypothetical protein
LDKDTHLKRYRAIFYAASGYPWGQYINSKTAFLCSLFPVRGLIKNVEIEALRAIGDKGVSYFAIDIIALRTIVVEFGAANPA